MTTFRPGTPIRPTPSPMSCNSPPGATTPGDGHRTPETALRPAPPAAPRSAPASERISVAVTLTGSRPRASGSGLTRPSPPRAPCRDGKPTRTRRGSDVKPTHPAPLFGRHGPGPPRRRLRGSGRPPRAGSPLSREAVGRLDGRVEVHRHPSLFAPAEGGAAAAAEGDMVVHARRRQVDHHHPGPGAAPEGGGVFQRAG